MSDWLTIPWTIHTDYTFQRTNLVTVSGINSSSLFMRRSFIQIAKVIQVIQADFDSYFPFRFQLELQQQLLLLACLQECLLISGLIFLQVLKNYDQYMEAYHKVTWWRSWKKTSMKRFLRALNFLLFLCSMSILFLWTWFICQKMLLVYL